MTMLGDNGSEALRKIARRVGALVRKHPSLANRLRQSWSDYIALHVGHMEERRRREGLQRQFAIEIMKMGFLEEQPRRDYEPSWDWESFYVRVPKQLIKARDAEKDRAKRAPIIAKLAAATLKYLDWDRRIKACTDKVSGKAMWDRMDAAMPIGKFVCETIRVGVRPRVEFSPPPHPLFCKWEEFQTLALPTRVTVALAVLAVLHDELSAVPVLAPLPRYRDDDPEGQLEAIVSDAVRDCLSVTQTRQGRSEPPTPDPKRLSIERAEAYLSILEAETERLSKMSPNQPTSGSSQTAGARSASALPGPGGSFVFLADNPPSLDGPYWEAPLRNWLLTVAMEVREKMGLIEPSTDPRVLAQVRLPLPPADDARQWLGLIATVFIDGRVPQRDYAAALACFGSGVRDLKWDGPVRPIKVEGRAVHVGPGPGGFVIDTLTLVSYTQNSLRRMATLVSSSPAADSGLIEQAAEMAARKALEAAGGKERNAASGAPEGGSNPPRAASQFAAAEDFTWVVFAGQSYRFGKGVQANVIRALWEAWERSGRRFGHGLGEEAIGAKADSSATKFRLAHVFRDHPAWKTLIRSVSKGVFALMPPESLEKHTS